MGHRWRDCRCCGVASLLATHPPTLTQLLLQWLQRSSLMVLQLLHLSSMGRQPLRLNIGMYQRPDRIAKLLPGFPRSAVSVLLTTILFCRWLKALTPKTLLALSIIIPVKASCPWKVQYV